jgi:type IV pilus assembly protein PilY1
MKTRLTIVLTSLCTVTASYAGPLAEAPLSVVTFVPSNVIFPLSVEFPTAVTAAYFGSSDYSSSKEYLGIFNPEKCYAYDTANSWFAPNAMATNRSCSNAWSGNFLNWATMTGLDEFRVAMTGGNRYVDTTTRTVLERTYLSDNQGSTGSNFPDKYPTAKSGAVPTAYESLTKIANIHMGVKMTVTNGGKNTDFYVRSVVCDPSVGGVDSLVKEHCTAYGAEPNYIYKPTGKIQKYGERMRFGVFSYFNSTSIDNAVMRSKAKFVAPNKWTASGATTNSNKEWDEATGILVTNPDPTDASASRGGAVSNSGVINYINKFGSSAQSYKTYDNFGKLWFEALRYLQGLPPTPDFFAKATIANGDGFPIITSWDDPVQYSCQKNFLMGMGDTHTWCDKRLPGAEFTSYANNQCRLITGTNGQLADQGSLSSDSDVDVSVWTDKIDAKETAVSNMSTSSIQNGASYNMAGLSYWAAYHGIRPMNNLTSHTPSTNPADNIKVKSFIIDVLENKDLGVNKQFWFATKYGGADSFDASGNPVDWSVKRTFSSPYPTFNNGDWPKTLLPAGDPEAMMAAVDAALATIDAESGTATSSAPRPGILRLNRVPGSMRIPRRMIPSRGVVTSRARFSM